ncbi:MAG: hypothetical protein RL208_639 [Pseudomonadota bacterium]|jgi:5-methyltetrahydropteroyltriglutamate--homocysteine methyltransferase
MVKISSIGFNRSGSNNDVANAVRKFCSKEIEEQQLLSICKEVRQSNWKKQIENDLDIVSSNDFSMLDHVLDMSCLVGNIQRRYYWEGGKIPLEIYFSMARGQQKDKFDVLPLEVEHFFNTNYLYYVPEFQDPIEFIYSDNKPILEYLEAKNTFKVDSRPIILGPISYLLLGKSKEDNIKPIDLLDDLLPVYQALFTNLKRVNVSRVQIDEPLLATELHREIHSMYNECYNKLASYTQGIKIDLVPYFGSIRDNFELILSLPVDSIHIDTFENEDYLDDYINKIANTNLDVSLGVVDGRNVWTNDFNQSIEKIKKFTDIIGKERVTITTSTPLTYCPYSAKNEKNVPKEIENLLSFSVEKLNELKILKNLINNETNPNLQETLSENRKQIERINQLKKTIEYDIKNNNIQKKDFKFDHAARNQEFQKQCKIPVQPTAIIGCMADKNNKPTIQKNITEINQKIKSSIAMQKDCEIDILSCTEFGRTDQTEFLASLCDGIYVLENNSIPYCGYEVHHPHIIYKTPQINNNILSQIATDAKKQCEKKTMKFSITGPVSFVNNAFCITEKHTLLPHCSEMIANEINRLINAGSDMIQINEVDILSNLSLKISQSRNGILNIINIINHITSQIPVDKKVGLYIGYYNFNDTIEDICRINMDFLFMESARSSHECLESFISYKPPMQIGIGLFDPRDSRVSTKNEISAAASKILMFFDEIQTIMIPDCDFFGKKDSKEITKILDTFHSVAKELRKKYLASN